MSIRSLISPTISILLGLLALSIAGKFLSPGWSFTIAFLVMQGLFMFLPETDPVQRHRNILYMDDIKRKTANIERNAYTVPEMLSMIFSIRNIACGFGPFLCLAAGIALVWRWDVTAFTAYLVCALAAVLLDRLASN